MNENKALLKLTEYKIYKKDLDNLDPEARAVISTLSYAVSETNVLLKLNVASLHKFSGDEMADAANLIQRSVLLRIWSAKLFEIFELIRAIAGKHFPAKEMRFKNKTLVAIAKESLKNWEHLESETGHRLARVLRNETTNHYSAKVAKDNWSKVSEQANFCFYIHDMIGNSFYPMGEEVVFRSRFKRSVGADMEDSSSTELFDIWMKWNMSASSWLNETHGTIVGKLLVDHFPNKVAEEDRVHWLPTEIVGEIDESLMPLFFRNSQKQ